MTLWISLGAMSLVAIVFVIAPLLVDMPRKIWLAAVAIVLISASSASLYWYKGDPGVPSGAGEAPDIQQMVDSLAERLRRQPDDVNGWKMLGRSYMTLGDPAAAVTAYEKAVELESALNASTLIALGVALAEAAGRQMTPIAISVFENALALEPNNPEALFWGGIGAFNVGNRELAADRWEQLLATNPAPEVEQVLRENIALWRGEEPPAVPQPPGPQTPEASAASIVTADISISDAARSSLPVNAIVFVIARDPAQPSPPIAVTRRTLSELPAVVEMGDREAMIPGRLLSAFTEFELVARVSLSGEPTARAGDWFGSIIVRPGDNNNVSISISEQVQ